MKQHSYTKIKINCMSSVSDEWRIMKWFAVWRKLWWLKSFTLLLDAHSMTQWLEIKCSIFLHQFLPFVFIRGWVIWIHPVTVFRMVHLILTTAMAYEFPLQRIDIKHKQYKELNITKSARFWQYASTSFTSSSPPMDWIMLLASSFVAINLHLGNGCFPKH